MSTDRPLDSIAIADEIFRSFVRGQRPILPEVDFESWWDALNVLVARGEFATAKFGAGLAIATFGESRPMESLWRMLDIAPPPDPKSPFARDDNSEVQVIRRAGAQTVVLVFCDANHWLAMHLVLAHRWFGRLDASIVYLRDRSRLAFLHGVPTMAGSREGTIARLQRLVRVIGGRRVVCYGNSIGGFAALLYGTELQADAVASIAGPTDLGILRNEASRGLQVPDVPWNLRDIVAAAPRPPQALFVCGESSWDDRLHVDNMAGIPSVHLGLIERQRGHVVAPELICRGQFASVLDWMMTATPEAPRAIGPFPYVPWRESVPTARLPGAQTVSPSGLHE